MKDVPIDLCFFHEGSTYLFNAKLEKGTYTIDQDLPVFELITEKFVQKVVIKFALYRNTLVFPWLPEDFSTLLGFNGNDLNEFGLGQLAKYETEYKKDKELENFNPESWRTKIELEKSQYIAESNFDIKAGFHTIFVYCDIIKPHLVGDTQTNLLKYIQVPNNAKYRDQVRLIFSKINYFPLISNEFESISLVIIYRRSKIGKYS